MIISSMPRLTASNSAYSGMSASNALMRLTASAGSFTGGMSTRALLASEQQLSNDMLTNSLTYRAAMAQEEALKKIQDQNIKRSFSTFA